MFMHSAMQVNHSEERGFLWHDAQTLTTEAFEPLSKRIGKSFSQQIQNLKQTLLASDFEDYIESIVSLKIIDGSLWLITDSPMHRSLLEYRFIPALKEAFDVDNVRIISQI